MMKFLTTLILLLTFTNSQAHANFNPTEILDSMTLEQKIGQLFMIRPDQLDTRLTNAEIHRDRAPGVKSMNDIMRATLDKYPAGGFAIFTKNISGPDQLKNFTQALKVSCNIIPFMAIDEEGGRISRIANHKNFHVHKFASTQSIGDTGNPENARLAASTIASYLREYGFNMNFAPVADVNTNSRNIVIGDRAFGTNPEAVSKMVGAYLDGLHERKILGSMKHFPGHGDTKDDTHSGYVAVNKTWEELLQCELIPFVENFSRADTVMIAHITMKNVTHDNLPASLSRELVTGKLRNELRYDGVVIADAMMMGAVAKNYTSSEAAILAIEAGCDILLMPYDYREAFNGILAAVKSGRISQQRLDESVTRILNLKEGL